VERWNYPNTPPFQCSIITVGIGQQSAWVPLAERMYLRSTAKPYFVKSPLS
jgi:hypothetical protein